MQGWRKTMEDAHIATTPMCAREDACLFAVFDGHGGSEVAKFCAKHLRPELENLSSFRDGDYEAALKQAFHRMDTMLLDEAHAPELAAVCPTLSPHPPSLSARVARMWRRRALMRVTACCAHFAVACPRKCHPMPWLQLANASKSPDGDEGDEDSRDGSGLLAQLRQLQDLKKMVIQNQSEGVQFHAGCTAVVAYKHGNKLYVANAGDSRGVLCRGGARPRPLPCPQVHGQRVGAG